MKTKLTTAQRKRAALVALRREAAITEVALARLARRAARLRPKRQRR